MEEVEFTMNGIDGSNTAEHSIVDDHDYFELNYFDLDHSLNGTPITPVTKYINSSSNILVELRKLKGNISRTNSWSTKLVQPTAHEIECQRLTHDENVSPCCPNINTAVAAPMPLVQKLKSSKSADDHPKLSEIRLEAPKNANHNQMRVKSINRSENIDYRDYIQSVRNNMNVTSSGRSDCVLSHGTLSESCIDYGSPGSFSDRAKAFSHGLKSIPKGPSGQVRKLSLILTDYYQSLIAFLRMIFFTAQNFQSLFRFSIFQHLQNGLKTSGKSFTTNVGKNNTCPKCNLVIFKAEELIAAGETDRMEQSIVQEGQAVTEIERRKNREA
jgi:hypothetical protein